MKYGILSVLLVLANNVFADVFQDNSVLKCSGYSVKVSTFCGCLSDLEESQIDNSSQKDCSSEVEVKKSEKKFKLKSISIRGCHQAFEFQDELLNFICIEAQYTSNIVSFFNGTLVNYEKRIKCSQLSN